MHIRVGTRKSELALAQTEIALTNIKRTVSNITFSILPFSTTGDNLYDANLSLIGGKGLFLKELEDKLLNDEIDIAIHSLKDVPAHLPSGLEIGAFLKRESPYDVLISNDYESLQDLPMGAVVGTSSSRRKVQLLHHRPDLNIVNFRGNVITRLKKLDEGQVDACVLAEAGINRLGLQHRISQRFSEDIMVPAVGQGVVCVEHKIGSIFSEILQEVDNAEARAVSEIERAFQRSINGDCTTPMGAFSIKSGDDFSLKTMHLENEKIKFNAVQCNSSNYEQTIKNFLK